MTSFKVRYQRLLKELPGKKSLPLADLFTSLPELVDDQLLLEKVTTAIKGLGCKLVDAAGSVKKPTAPKRDRTANKALDDPIRMYFTQMASIPLLTREEEIQFAMEIEISQKKLTRLVELTEQFT